ncbi:MAG: CBS domain-containing protein [Myxococcales bacterium]|nr:CBS domain-containing protein [Myxococcales bacterium]
MDLIVTHANTDFDALAAQIAASKLYPGAVLGRTARVSRHVRDFLALHKDRFALTPANEVPFQEITRIILVDVRRRSRLSEYASILDRVPTGGVEVHVWDHHDPSPDDIPGVFERVEAVGSVTTLLVEEIRRRDLHVDAVEATLLALGVYADTGSLTYVATTARDARAAAWLLARGASLKMVRRYLKTPLTDQHRTVLGSVLGDVELIELSGVRVGLVCHEVEKPVSGLAEVANALLDSGDFEALFALFPRAGKPRVQVIARSRVPYLDVGEVMQHLGGGGYGAAAAADVKGATGPQVREQIIAFLRQHPPKPHLVRHFMSSPVVVVEADQTLREARARFHARAIHGAPVLRDGKLCGVISLRDIGRAERSDKLDLPVSSHMSHEVKTAGVDDLLERSLDLMVEADIGRLPVLEDDAIVGIITRSDLLKVLYPSKDVG